jgi:hypothetical protein
VQFNAEAIRVQTGDSDDIAAKGIPWNIDGCAPQRDLGCRPVLIGESFHRGAQIPYVEAQMLRTDTIAGGNSPLLNSTKQPLLKRVRLDDQQRAAAKQHTADDQQKPDAFHALPHGLKSLL